MAVFHRYAMFHPQTGVCLGPGCMGNCWEGWLPDVDDGAIGMAPPGASAADPQYQINPVYVPMDDHMDEWWRIEAEFVHAHHPGDDSLNQGNYQGLTHADGTPHPTLSHVQFPGTFTWGHDPSPAVSARIQAHRRTHDAVGASLDHHYVKAYSGLEPR